MVEFDLVRSFRSMHDELRARGMNPLEAAAEFSRALAQDPASDSADDFTQQVHQLLHGAPPNAAAVAFQTVISSDLRQALGQYLTPQAVAEHVARRLSGLLPPSAVVMDPFAGTGVLLHSVAAVRPDVLLQGQEVNPLVASLGQGFMSLAGSPVDIDVRDTFAEWPEGVADAIVTNPPFGGKLLTEQLISQGVRLPDSLASMSRVPLEVLGLQWSVTATRLDGLVAIVLPYSVMTNSNLRAYREELFKSVELLAISILPEATFAPFKGVAKSCVLFIRKSGMPTSVVRVSRSREIGYDETGRVSGPCDLPELDAIAARNDGEQWQFEEGHLRRGATAQGLRLGSIATAFRGKNPGRGVTDPHGPVLVKVGTLTGHYVPWLEGSTQVPEKTYSDRSRWLQVGDICLTATAHKPRYVGLKVDYIDCLPPVGAVPSAEVMVVRLTSESPVSPPQLLAWLRSADGYEALQELVRGSTAHLYPKDLEDLVIPDLSDRFDASVVGSRLQAAAKAYRTWEGLEAALPYVAADLGRAAAED